MPEVASVFFGVSLSSHQLRDLVRDTRLEQLREAGDMQDLPDAADKLESIIHQLRLALGQTDRRAAWSEVAGDVALQSVLQQLAECLQQLLDWLEIAAERGKGLESCRARAALISERLTLLMNSASSEYIHWFETFRTSFRLNLTPLNVAPVFPCQAPGCLPRRPSRSVTVLNTLPDSWGLMMPAG